MWALAPRPWTTRSSKDLWIELSLKALEYLEDTLTPDHAEKSSDDEAGGVEASHSTIKVHSPHVLVIHMNITSKA